MNIGIVLSRTPGYSETFFKSKIYGLQKNGHHVILFVQKNDTNFSDCLVRTSIPFKLKKLLKLISGFIRVIMVFFKNPKRCLKFVNLQKQDGYSLKEAIKHLITNTHIIGEHLDWLHFGFATMALGREQLAKAMGAKMAVSLRGFDIAIYPINHKDCYKLLWKHIDKIHTISDDLLKLAYKSGLPLSVPTAKITPAINSQLFNTIIPKHNPIENEYQFLTVARLHWKKGLLYTLEALHLLKEKGIKFRYNIIGDGPQREEIQFSIYQLGLENEVSLLGIKTPLEVRDYMKLTSIYLQYSISEGFCNAVLEAQSMGLLCIVSDAEGLAENVLHDETGWVVTKNNSKALAESLYKVIHLSDEIKNHVRTKAQNRIKKSFNLEKQQKEFIEFYN